MSEQEPLDDNAELEARLKRFQPNAVRLDPSRLWFEAGRAAALAQVASASPAKSSRQWLWKITTIAASVTAAYFAGRVHELSSQPSLEKPGREKIAYIERAVPALVPTVVRKDSASSQPQSDLPRQPNPDPALTPHYLRSRQVALSIGLDGLGSPLLSVSETSSPQRYVDAVREFLSQPTGSAPTSTAPAVESVPGLSPGERS